MKALYPALVLAALSAIAQAAASEKTCTLPKNRAAHQVGCLQDGLAAYSEKGRYGYVDENGEIVIPLQYDVAAPFANGMAIVSKRGYVGMINRQGETVLPPEYDQISPYSDGLALITQKNQSSFIDLNGKQVMPWREDCPGYFQQGQAPAGCDKARRYTIDKSGNTISDQYTAVDYYFEGLTTAHGKNAAGEDKEGYVDEAGNVVIPFQYDYASVFVDGIARVGLRRDGKTRYGYIDPKGNVVIPVEYEYADESYVQENRIALKKNGLYGYADTQGRAIL